MKKTLNNVELQNQHEQLGIDSIMETLKDMAKTNFSDQDFILVTGIYRVEFHHSSKIFVIEQRHFDHEKLEDNEED